MFNLPAAFASDKSAVLCKPLLYFMEDTGNHPCVSWNEPFPTVGQVVVCFFLPLTSENVRKNDIVEKPQTNRF